MTYANIYRYQGAWAYALWIDGEFDHSDIVDCLDSVDFDAAADALREELSRPDLDVREI